MKVRKYLDEPSFSAITQGFCVPNEIYRSKFHFGCDHGIRGGKDTIYFPCDAEVIFRFPNTDSSGNAVTFKITDDGTFGFNPVFRVMHMRDTPPALGHYKMGDVIGHIGNTGNSFGAHLHIDVSKNTMILPVTKAIIDANMLDAHKLICDHLTEKEAPFSLFSFTSDLKKGDTSEDVKKMQEFLNTHNFPIVAEGQGSKGQETTYFGGMSETALKAFQSANSFPSTGVLDKTTRDFINSIICKK